MSTENAAAGGELEPAPVIGAPTLDLDTEYSVEQAVADFQKKKNAPAESAEPATAETESEAKAEDAAPPEEVHGEDEGADPAAEPPIERPKSWTEAEDAEWKATPRALQQKIVARELERDSNLRRAQNEAADARKAAEADQAKWKQEREQYVSKQSAYTQALETALQNEFGDIQTMNDVRKLQAEDPFRFQQWQLRQMELGHAKAEERANEQRTLQERQSKRTVYETEQNKRLIELVPDMADVKKSVEIRERAVATLTNDLELSMDQLTRWLQDDIGHEILSNAGIQKMIYEFMKQKEVKAAPAKALTKPVPAVQKPGVSAPKGAQAAESVQALRTKLNGSGSVEDAFALYQAKRRRSAS
ncbi:hypothetical protein AYJ54_00700 [Bradyrhizobium centrolobii]|uniref:Uncharacterized protein n=1 Tax=Bradyrhizobium centrolobii TaxID=1505087 RepID=A0A176YGM5_9BRAD|nr:hypothetical protein [Bradyrhizobium centrolobii]OAF05457.1 hypothetical protein AYJ54_00700 [Bradyrhizobium centrolobii]